MGSRDGAEDRTTIVTLQKRQAGGGMVGAYLADGSGEPILFRSGPEAFAWANMNRALFEAEKGDVIVRGRFGSVSSPTEHGAVAMIEGRAPCFPIDLAYVQDEDDPTTLLHVDDPSKSVSLRPDMEAYARRIGAPPADRP